MSTVDLERVAKTEGRVLGGTSFFDKLECSLVYFGTSRYQKLGVLSFADCMLATSCDRRRSHRSSQAAHTPPP